MNPFVTVQSKAIPLDIANVDTDQIIPKQFLKRVERSGFGQFLFFDWRFFDDGAENPDFILNQKDYQGASILLARENFGCGSSREHAPWALSDYGINVVIAPSYADIFYNNCFQNGILPIELDNEKMDIIFEEAGDGNSFTIDLEKQTIHNQKTGNSVSFDIDEARKDKLLQGLDDISSTMQLESNITKYEENSINY